MNTTYKHLLVAIAWLSGWPLVFTPLFVKGVLPAAPVYTIGVTLIWGLGLIACFTSWAWRDAPAHGKPQAAALWFTAGWLLVFVLAMFPYLFYTRGVKDGIYASAQFFAACVVGLTVFTGVGMVSRLFI